MRNRTVLQTFLNHSLIGLLKQHSKVLVNVAFAKVNRKSFIQNLYYLHMIQIFL